MVPPSALSAYQLHDRDIRSRGAGHIDARNSFPTPVPWLRRLGSALHLKDFGGEKTS
ncbi:hypothetical protein FOMA001_g13055 [Fusarium oxysporum f. sp. matthiolae]|nr:hypothetical protein FOMA001_g13055 [Fusarium oxysporum f. sp. matthiolae]